MNTGVQQHEVIKEAKTEKQKSRHERVREQIDMRHKGVRTGIAAGGLLALMGLSALFLA